MSAPSDVRPRLIDTTNDYVGVYVSDTLDLTRKLSLTLGGRYNYARLDLQNLDPDPAFPDLLTGTHTYERARACRACRATASRWASTTG